MEIHLYKYDNDEVLLAPNMVGVCSSHLCAFYGCGSQTT